MAKRRTKRIPKLTFTNTRGIGWHVCYREPATGLPCKHHFGIRERERESDARVLYQAWLASYIGGNGSNATTLRPMVSATVKTNPNVLSGSVLEIASGLTEIERSRARKDSDARRRGSIAPSVFRDRKKQIRDFLEFLDERRNPMVGKASDANRRDQ